MKNGHSDSRKQAIKEAFAKTPRQFEIPRDEKGVALKISEYFGENTFDIRKMRDRLPKDTFRRFMQTLQLGKKLDADIATAIAQAVKDWAISKGVTHYTHWFQPQTGLTAEKHDAFINFDDQGQVIETFTAGQLIQSEPDASSFPSGGMRATFEARGYTAWDPSSPIFISEAGGTKTLCIPSVFISYHGDALDEKAPLLRSMDVISEKALKLLSLMGDQDVLRVVTSLGPEQEYFLVDRAFYSARPDLVMTGRSLLGGQPPRGQQLEDHYFGSVPERVQAFMAEAELELYKLGVPVKTRHNEVAPSQFECAPIYENAEVAVDHNQLTMETLRKVALRHGFQVLFHEKPFAGLNGTGKHCNWSISIVSSNPELNGFNLTNPGKTPHQNLRFLMFLAAVLRGVYKHSGMLRAAIASAGNDHRLGANEAPPAIISVFLGAQLNRILDEIAENGGSSANAGEQVLKLGLSKLPEIPKDTTDRNRTSPFAFTGNKFEFRAVGGSANPAFPVAILNAAVADGIVEMTEKLRKKLEVTKNIDEAVFAVVRESVIETKAIRFEGNNYSDEWVIEAERRGLPNLRKTPEALNQLVSETSKKALVGLGIFSEQELNSRHHVREEIYVENMLIEVDTMKLMVDTHIMPACYGYLGCLAETVASMKAAGMSLIPQSETLAKVAAKVESMQVQRKALESAVAKVDSTDDFHSKAALLAKEVAPAMADLREVVDALEGMVADDFWPFPKYREMLFIS